MSPMMEQFWRAKREQPDALLFFRMGDFYELFHDDAKVASRELGITLTSRSKGDDAIAMAGVPIKAAEGYLIRLVRKGFKVAICEQLSDPRKTSGIVDRDIVRVVTPGTITEENALDARENNFLACLYCAKEGAGLAWVDVSTGRFQVSVVPLEEVGDEIARIQPAELLWDPTTAEQLPTIAREVEQQQIAVSERETWHFDRQGALRALTGHFKVATLAGYGIEDHSPAVPAAGALIEYLLETQRNACEHVITVELIDSSRFLVIDRATRACLELTRTQREGRREGTLLDAIDGTVTPMGSRLQRSWLLSPLRDVDAILERQAGVQELVDAPFLREELRGLLGDVLDIERLAARVSTGRAGPRDLVALRQSISVAPPMIEKLSNSYSKILGALRSELDPLDDLCRKIQETLVDAPPLNLRDGGIVRDGFSSELDELRQIAGDGKSWMARFQAEESERAGIPGLKIGYNSVFGYYIEVPRGQIARVPETYIRKQTIKSAERYITPELKEFESKVLKSEERSKDLEHDIFTALRETVGAAVRRVLDTARAIARIDVLAGLAQKAVQNRYVAPTVDRGDVLRIVDGRHPVIELNPQGEAFVPNDSHLSRNDRLVTLITGPNMAGKSTYIRQTALITLMAQMGSFVPAGEAKIGVCDRIFTRLGSADDIARGASTFMVEMIEIANILNNATRRSLVVLDEVGRGTSTFDGLALAWAIVEHIHDRIGARTLFATHYHQLTDLATRLKGVVNMNVAVREWNDEIIFLHKIVEGATDRSYGIHVARLAGVPRDLLGRAKEILHELEDSAEDASPRIVTHSEEDQEGPQQLRLFERGGSPIEEALRQLDPERMTPLECLLKLAELKKLL